MKSVTLAALSLLLATPVYAGYDIGTSTGGFALITTWMQSFVDFMDGPAGIAFVVVSMIAGVVVWVWAPKSGAVGILLRVVVGALVIFNVGTWVSTF